MALKFQNYFSQETYRLIGSFFDTMIVASSDIVVTITHQNLSTGNSFEPP